MGNCLNCVRGGQQDNANLLTSGSDPAGLGITAASSQDNLRQHSLPAYNEMAGNYYPAASTREHHLQSTEMGMNHGIGIGVGLGSSGGSIINDEEQQIRMAKRIGLIQHLPTREFDGTKKGECVICMMELVVGEEVRYLPCMHTYHAVCIDDWLLRSLTCPTCMEPVDAALINSYHPTT
ncbi:RING finger protein 11-like [Phymastichus coffea]|uniref:RING finger protein 11-like n=1 Tax=Phymastichus coffea TaxID=108790 RepID=UPI00273A86F2|nr:RING finger protein 11-like [Phymastichus coffea]